MSRSCGPFKNSKVSHVNATHFRGGLGKLDVGFVGHLGTSWDICAVWQYSEDRDRQSLIDLESQRRKRSLHVMASTRSARSFVDRLYSVFKERFLTCEFSYSV